ncbi:MAG: SRPBCC family protein [Tumebacillaceae bacterium]
MPVIRQELYIQAPIDVCFDLARNVDVHTETTAQTRERVVGGVTHGLMELGDTVTWEATHFGIKQQLTAKITLLEKPHRFVDVMVKGAFQSFTHTHEFVANGAGTTMIDQFEYKSPFGLIGQLADVLFLKRYMARFLRERAVELKRIAESGN